MKKIILKLALAGLLCTITGIFCTNMENPYLNPKDSRVEFKQLNVKDGDTVSIFSRDSISVLIYLREHLSNFKLSASKNRFWTDTVISSEAFDSDHSRFKFSFYDTGWQEITLTSHKTNGDSSTQSFRLYAKSPLKQNTLEIKAGDSVTLNTDPVLEDVFYVWDLHDQVIKDYTPSTRVLFDEVPSSSVGEIYVIDRNDNRSPSSFFLIKEITSTATNVTITSQNDSVSGDTIYTSTPTIQLIVKVSGITTIKEFSINGIINSHKITNADGSYLFYETFQNLDSLSQVTVIFQVKDNVDNITTDTMIIKYTESTIYTTPVITVQNPSKDSSTSNNQTISVYGSISNSSKFPSGVVFYSNNGNLQDGYTRLSDGTFVIPVKLDVGRNELKLFFNEDTLSQSNILATKDLIVVYDPSSTDSVAPKILFVFNDDRKLTDSSTFRQASLPLNIWVTDNSPIRSVLVNGQAAQIASDSLSYDATITLKHPDNSITITATDIYNNSSFITYELIRYNRVPSISVTSLSSNYLVDTLATWRISTSDADNDSLTVTATVNNTLLLMKQDNTVTWTPTINDTGWQNITFQVYDKYETYDTTFSINISKAPDADIPVQWLTNGSNIPDTLFVGIDTLQVAMTKNPLSNLPPFQYTVELIDVQKIIYSGTDSLLVWVPQTGDIGTHQIRFTITDAKNNKNEFTDNIVISPVSTGISFEKAAFSCSESTSTFPVNVVLSKKLNIPVTVSYSIVTAQTTASSSDYTIQSQSTLTFNAGDSIKSIDLSIVNDETAESDEKVVFKLSNPSTNAYIDSQSTTTFTILDDDYATYSFTASQGEGSESTQTVNIEIQLSKACTKDVTINCAVDDQLTTAGSLDYSLTSSNKSITFSAGETRKTIQLRILTDILNEYDEIVALRLSSTSSMVRAGSIVLYKYTISGTIEATSNFYIDTYGYTVQESAQDLVISIRRDNATTSASVYFALNSELTTADSSQDFYITTSSPLTFEKNVYSKSITIHVIDDAIKESSEKIVIDITKVSTGSVLASSPSQVEFTIDSND